MTRPARPPVRLATRFAMSLAARLLPPVLLAVAGPAAAAGLACPAASACNNAACGPDAGPLLARVVPVGADGVGLAAGGRAARPVEAVSRGSGPAMVVTYYTEDGAEMIAIRAADLGFSYRRRRAMGWLTFSGTCRPE